MEIITVYYGVEVIDVKTKNLKNQSRYKKKKNITITNNKIQKEPTNGNNNNNNNNNKKIKKSKKKITYAHVVKVYLKYYLCLYL